MYASICTIWKTCGIRIVGLNLARYLMDKGYVVDVIGFQPMIGGAMYYYDRYEPLGSKLDRVIGVTAATPTLTLPVIAISLSRPAIYAFLEGEVIASKEIREYIASNATFVAPNDFVKNMIKRSYGVDPEVHPCGITDPFEFIDSYSIEVARLQIKKKRNRKLVCYVAWNYPRKCIDDFFEIARVELDRLGDEAPMFLWITNEVDEDRLADKPRNLDVLPILKGCSFRQLYSIMYNCDIYIHVAGSEGLGIPIIEAQMMGIPAIVPTYEPVKNLAIDGYSIAVPIRSEEKLEDPAREQVYTLKRIDIEKALDAIEELLRSRIDRFELRDKALSRFLYKNAFRGIEKKLGLSF